jgi:hypothetical protein
MDDRDIIEGINRLAHEEHELYEKESIGQASSNERARLRQIEISLDQLYDLLHQRRARRNAGLDPDEVQMRDPDVVEGYVD